MNEIAKGLIQRDMIYLLFTVGIVVIIVAGMGLISLFEKVKEKLKKRKKKD